MRVLGSHATLYSTYFTYAKVYIPQYLLTVQFSIWHRQTGNLSKSRYINVLPWYRLGVCLNAHWHQRCTVQNKRQ